MTSVKYDFIVVGAGAAGCSLASGLARRNLKVSVLLLEAGSEASDPAFTNSADHFRAWQVPNADTITYGYKDLPQPQLNGKELQYHRGKGSGGTTLINGSIWDYGCKEDLNEWASLVDDEAWSWKRASASIRKMENYRTSFSEDYDQYLRFEPGSHGSGGPIDISVPPWKPGLGTILDAAKEYGFPLTTDLNNDQGVGIGPVVFSYLDGRRLTAASIFLSDKPNNLTILVEVPVTRILFDGKKAVGVEVLNGSQYLAEKDVILSAGTIDTPKLLLLSGIGPAHELNNHGISTISNLPGVGKGFRDHIIVPVVYKIKPGALPESEPMNNERVGEKSQREFKDHSLIGYFKLPRESKIETWPELQSLPERDRVLMMKPDVPDWELLAILNDPLPDGTILFSCCAVGMHAQSRGSITLKSADPKDAPVIDLKYLSHPYDQRAMEYAKNAITGACHGSGTAKMGRLGEKDTCVDNLFRVLGVDNLRVVDMSICPVVPCVHPQAIAYLIGVTAAEHIISEYKLEI